VQPYVVEATIRFRADADVRAPGGLVTIALCGHWDHDGPCRWPHRTEADEDRLRVLYVAQPDEQYLVQALIEGALHTTGTAWTVDRCGPAEPTADETRLAARWQGSDAGRGY
jgi:hypothetical protein